MTTESDKTNQVQGSQEFVRFKTVATREDGLSEELAFFEALRQRGFRLLMEPLLDREGTELKGFLDIKVARFDVERVRGIQDRWSNSWESWLLKRVDSGFPEDIMDAITGRPIHMQTTEGELVDRQIPQSWVGVHKDLLIRALKTAHGRNVNRRTWLLERGIGSADRLASSQEAVEAIKAQPLTFVDMLSVVDQKIGIILNQHPELQSE